MTNARNHRSAPQALPLSTRQPAPSALPRAATQSAPRAAAIGLAVLLAAAPGALAQQKTFDLSDDGQWSQTQAPEPGSDKEIILRAREMIAQGRDGAAEALLDGWIERNERTDNPWLAEAYLARGDARLASDREVKALYDYEEVIKNFPGSEAFVIALTRELDIAIRYANGLRKRILGIRLENAERIGEDLMIRVQERLPKSRLAERACLELADYYYRERDMASAATMYDIFLKNYPESEFRQKALQRRVYANIAQFKGPRYDASGLREAKFLIQDYSARYPQDAERIGMDNALIARLDESAAVQMLETARWYLRRDDDVSARLTVARLLRKHPRTVAAIRAQELISERKWVMPGAAPPGEPAGEEASNAEDPTARADRADAGLNSDSSQAGASEGGASAEAPR
jgi:Outer membrane lipoprotein